MQFSNDVKVEAPLGPVDMEGLQRVKREMVRGGGGGWQGAVPRGPRWVSWCVGVV